MSDNILLLYRQILSIGFMIIISLFLLAFVFSGLKTDSSRVRAESTKPAPTDMAASPNVITSGLAAASEKLDRITDSTFSAIGNGIAAVGSTVSDSGRFVARNVGSGVSSAGKATGKGISLVANIPGDVLGAVVNDDAINAVIRPDNDHVEIPIIDPNSPELQAAIASLPPASDVHAGVDPTGAGPIWPIHGRITAAFGVDHRPYQRTHTGLDISDGKPVGTTPAKPFRPGKVIEAVHTKQGLGNHVIVDHGNGVTSVYAHLNSISVSVGQQVTHATTLGFVGTTGVSTGPHLHFEIRVNGKAADPRKFISGHPGDN